MRNTPYWKEPDFIKLMNIGGYSLCPYCGDNFFKDAHFNGCKQCALTGKARYFKPRDENASSI